MRRAVMIGLGLALSACGAYSSDDESGGGAGGGAGGAGAPSCDTPRAGYPTGPFGQTEGAVIENLGFTDSAGAALDFAALRTPCARRLLLVANAAGWCVACREHQPALQALYEDFRDDGLVVLVAYFEDDDFDPATVEHAAAWKRRYSLTFPVVLDAGFALGAYYDRELTPVSMLIDLETMQIVLLETGYDDSRMRSLVEARL